MNWKTLVADTVGYNECEHKEAFLLGAHMMHTKITTQHQKEIESLNRLLAMSASLGESYQKDLRTIADILHNARAGYQE